MRRIVRVVVASFAACLLAGPIVGHAPTAHARRAALEVIWSGKMPRPLSPGSSMQVVVRGLGAAPAGGYCLGMASLRDRYGIPVTLGALEKFGAGQLGVRATIPSALFPAEPAGPFLLFVGQCTSVAPEGIFASMQITILPAGHSVE